MTDQLYFINREYWRAWLEQNHDSNKEAWLVHYKKHTGKPSIPYEDAVEEALCFGWIDGLVRRIDHEKYAVRYSPRKRSSVWAESNKKRVQKMIEQGRMTEAGLAKIKQAKDSGEWHSTTQRETLEVPPELEKALAVNEKAKNSFHSLTPSRQKQFIWWISSAKRKETREKRIKEVLRLVELDH